MRWFELNTIRPHIVAEFDDSALLKSFGQAGAGILAAPTSIKVSVSHQSGVKNIGFIDSVKEQLYAYAITLCGA